MGGTDFPEVLRVGPGPDLANRMTVLSDHCRWFRDGHVTQAQPTEIFHKTFAGALWEEASFYTGVTNLVRCGVELGTVICATIGRELPQGGSYGRPISYLIQIYPLFLAAHQLCPRH